MELVKKKTKNKREQKHTFGSAVTQRCIIVNSAEFCLPRESSYLCVICSSNSTRYCFGTVKFSLGTVYHYSAMVVVLGK